MAAATEISKTRLYLKQWLREGAIILMVTIASYLALALFSYDAGDPGWTNTGTHNTVQNWTGRVGAWIADVLMLFFGYVAYLLPILLAARGLSLLWHREPVDAVNWPLIAIRTAGFVVFILACCTLMGMYSVAGLGPDSGGVVGRGIADGFQSVFNLIGGTLLTMAILLTSISLATGLSWLKLMDWVGARTLWLMAKMGVVSRRVAAATRQGCQKAASELGQWQAQRRERQQEKQQEKARLEPELENKRSLQREKKSLPAPREAALVAEREPWDNDSGLTADAPRESAVAEVISSVQSATQKAAKAIRIEPFKKKSENGSRPKKGKKQGTLFDVLEDGLPSLDLLDPPEEKGKAGFSREELERLSRLLELRLAEFNVDAEVVEVNPGPVITRFEIQPAPGVKVSKINALAKDLARSLAVVSVRVVDVIPGKSVIGIEIPNENREMVRLVQVLSSSEYEDSHSPLTLGLGYDIAGNSVVANLAKMPHLLVAGTTGSGKSVGVNAMILSMLYKAGPADLRLIMIDPKMLELSVYEGIPHLLTPVVTDMKEADNALRWCVGEMERRYKLMAALGVRNLAGFNTKVQDARSRGEPIMDPLWRPDELALEGETQPELETLPFIVVIVDEFADMMMIVGKKVEEKIARIAQKARAAGIHLVLATQRPSVDVITGLIKANIPTRIAFQVSSKIDSRTILDQGGAEQLLGHGDMLYLPPGTGLPVRVHGAFVDDEEVHRVVEAWKQRGQPDYLEEILNGGEADFIPGIDPASSADQGGEQDALFDEAVAFVTESRKASISAVQRKLRIGYNRAATLVEAMESAGVVSPAGHNGSREVLAPPPVRD